MKQLLAFLFLMGCLGAGAQEKLYPAVVGYGPVFAIPDATEKPDPALKYQILVDVSTNNDKPEIINENLENAAKVMNLHRLAGINAKNFKLAVIIHGPAAVDIMNNESYHKNLE